MTAISICILFLEIIVPMAISFHLILGVYCLFYIFVILPCIFVILPFVWLYRILWETRNNKTSIGKLFKVNNQQKVIFPHIKRKSIYLIKAYARSCDMVAPKGIMKLIWDYCGHNKAKRRLYTIDCDLKHRPMSQYLKILHSSNMSNEYDVGIFAIPLITLKNYFRYVIYLILISTLNAFERYNMWRICGLIDGFIRVLGDGNSILQSKYVEEIHHCCTDHAITHLTQNTTNNSS